MKFFKSGYELQHDIKETISSPVDLFYNDPKRYKNRYPKYVKEEVRNIHKLKPEVAVIKSLTELKAYLKTVELKDDPRISLEGGTTYYDVKYIITKHRDLLLGEFICVGNSYVTHPAIVKFLGYKSSDKIVAAGRIIGTTNVRGNFEVYASNQTGHFKTGVESVKHLDALLKRWGGYGVREIAMIESY